MKKPTLLCVILFLSLAAACAGAVQGPATPAARAPTPTEAPATPAAQTPLPSPARETMTPAHLPETLDRPPDLFSPDSPFLQPIPDDPPIDPNSDVLIQDFAENVREFGFNISIRAFAVPVFFAGPETPRQPVRLSAEWTPWQAFGPVPIPPHARPDPEDDGHLAVVDRETGCIYEFWQARKVGERWVASWGNALRMDGDGLYPQGGGARAGGSSLLAGLIWPEELRRGEIAHALVFAYGKTRAGGPVPPATASDGWSPDPDALPEGALLQLDPAFDVNTLPEWQRPIARALQTYGMYLMDTTGGDAALFAVHPYSLARDPYDDLIPASAWRGDRPNAREWAVLDIPPERFRVLRMGPQRPNPTELTPPACGATQGGWREGVWGVATEGTVAYIAAGVDGLQVVDLGDPQTPRLLGAFMHDDMEPAVSVRVQHGRAYVGTAGTGLWILDVSDPARPALLGRFGFEEEHAFLSMAMDGETLYLADEGILYVVDISDPSRPRALGLLEDPDVISDPVDLAVTGDQVLLADRNLGLTLVDVSTPSRPRWQGVYWDYGEGVVAGERVVALLNHRPGLRVLDLANPAAPKPLASAALPDFAYRGVLQGPWLFLADGLGGLQVVEMSDPASPRVVAQLEELPGYARDLTAIGPFLYIALQDGGLAVVDVEDPARPRVVAIHPAFLQGGEK